MESSAATFPQEEPADEAEAAVCVLKETAELCNVRLSVCYSPSYGVPVLWLEAYRRNGAPLSLVEILHSSIFVRPDRQSEMTPALQQASNDSAPTPPVLLSQADHPATGHYYWFLHPCETEAMVNEVLESTTGAAEHAAEDLPDANEQLEDLETGSPRSRRWAMEWLEAWLMVVGSLVDLYT
ncbi:hypothetical protein JCM10908_006113 [Rhodotorula pacifica]|uniref:ATG3/ATG10 family protein n=1 Tax=Rhodotorula pacifica TaxID=1495444 RepID=UPI00317FDA16